MADGTNQPPPRTRWARAAVTAVFLTHGAVFASWAARIPAVRAGLRLSDATLGLVLAGPGIGALAGSQLGGLAVRRFGSRAVSGWAPLLLCLPLGLVPLARSAWSLGALLVLLGAADGATSVAMNAQAVAVQHAYGRTVLNGMHAARSLGAVAGGAAGVAASALALPLAGQFTATALALACLAGVAACGLAPDPPERRRPAPAPAPATAPGPTALPTPSRTTPRAVLAALAAMAFLGALVEDAPASWSGVYLRHTGAGAATAAAGYAAFCAGEVAARLVYDRLVARAGWPLLIRCGTLTCAVVLAGALAAGRPGVTLAALVVAGAGVGAVFPAAFARAGTLPAPAFALAQVGFAGNVGWLAVSPLIGALAGAAGLTAALCLLPLAALALAGLAGFTRTQRIDESSYAVRTG